MINILIADDNIYYAKILMNTINGELRNNIKVSHIATDGQETISLLQTCQIDIILLDLKMPIYNGIDILNIIEKKQMKQYKESIIVISGEDEMLNGIRENEYIYRILNKICSISKIIDTINELLENKQENKKQQNIKRQLVKELQYLNYNLSHKGTLYLIDTIILIYNKKDNETFNLKEEIYPIIAKRYDETIHNIKSNINKANDYMYRVCKEERIQSYFKFFDRTKPTVKNVIYTIITKIEEKVEN